MHIVGLFDNMNRILVRFDSILFKWHVEMGQLAKNSIGIIEIHILLYEQQVQQLLISQDNLIINSSPATDQYRKCIYSDAFLSSIQSIQQLFLGDSIVFKINTAVSV